MHNENVSTGDDLDLVIILAVVFNGMCKYRPTHILHANCIVLPNIQLSSSSSTFPSFYYHYTIILSRKLYRLLNIQLSSFPSSPSPQLCLPQWTVAVLPHVGKWDRDSVSVKLKLIMCNDNSISLYITIKLDIVLFYSFCETSTLCLALCSSHANILPDYSCSVMSLSRTCGGSIDDVITQDIWWLFNILPHFPNVDKWTARCWRRAIDLDRF